VFCNIEGLEPNRKKKKNEQKTERKHRQKIERHTWSLEKPLALLDRKIMI